MALAGQNACSARVSYLRCFVGQHNHIRTVAQQFRRLEFMHKREHIAVVAAQQFAQARWRMAFVAFCITTAPTALNVLAICSSSSVRSVTTTNVQLPTSLVAPSGRTPWKAFRCPASARTHRRAHGPTCGLPAWRQWRCSHPKLVFAMILTSPALCSENSEVFHRVQQTGGSQVPRSITSSDTRRGSFTGNALHPPSGPSRQSEPTRLSVPLRQSSGR